MGPYNSGMCPGLPGTMSFGNPHSCHVSLSVGQVLPVAVLSAGATIGPYAWEGHKEDPSFPGELLELPSRQANMHEIFAYQQ